MASEPIHAFQGSFNQYIFHTIFCTSHWLLSHIAMVETTDSCERGMNPVAMTIISPRKEYWPGRRFEPATSCSQVRNATDLATGARQTVAKESILVI